MKYIILLIIVLLSTYTYALGIRPAQTTAHFVPNAAATYTFKIVNDEKIDMTIVLSASGNIDDIIFFPKKEFQVSADQDIVPVEFQLLFPESMNPGEHTGSVVVSQQEGSTRRVGALELSNETLEELTRGGISARLQLLHKVNLNVPIKGKYVVANLALRDLELDKLNVVTDVKNEGFEKVHQLTSQVRVLDENNVLEFMPLDSASLDLQEKLRFEHALEKTKFDQGTYTVLAEIIYDNARIELSKKLLIGNPQINIRNTEPYVVAGKINDWDIEVENLWNKALEDQSFEAILRKDGNEVSRWKTFSFDIAQREIKQIKTYVDATQLQAGDYEIELKSLTGVSVLDGKRVLKLIYEDAPATHESPLIVTLAVLLAVIMMLLIGITTLIIWKRKNI